MMYTEFLNPESNAIFHLDGNSTDRYLLDPVRFVLGGAVSEVDINGFLKTKTTVTSQDGTKKKIKVSTQLIKQRKRVYDAIREGVSALIPVNIPFCLNGSERCSDCITVRLFHR